MPHISVVYLYHFTMYNMVDDRMTCAYDLKSMNNWSHMILVIMENFSRLSSTGPPPAFLVNKLAVEFSKTLVCASNPCDC